MKRISGAGHRLVVASVVIAVVAATGSTAPASADPMSTISGTVARADGGSPEGIVVATRCDDESTWPWELSTTTTAAADGSYSLPNPAGSQCASVFVEFHDPSGAYVSQFYDDTLVDYEATTVGPAPGDTALAPQVLSHVAGAIRGRVVDSHGHRVHDADLQVRAGSDALEDTVALPPASLGPKGGFVLRSLLPGARYRIAITEGSRYSPGVNPRAAATLAPGGGGQDHGEPASGRQGPSAHPAPGRLARPLRDLPDPGDLEGDRQGRPRHRLGVSRQ